MLPGCANKQRTRTLDMQKTPHAGKEGKYGSSLEPLSCPTTAPCLIPSTGSQLIDNQTKVICFGWGMKPTRNSNASRSPNPKPMR